MTAPLVETSALDVTFPAGGGLFQRAGARVISVPVRHRPRTQGTSKYGLHNRLWVGIVDLFGVRWLIVRNPPPVTVSER